LRGQPPCAPVEKKGQHIEKVNLKEQTRLRAVVLLEAPPPAPSVAVIAICGDRTSEPIASLLDLAFGPEETSDGDDDGWRVVGFLEGVDRARLAGRPRFAPDRVRV
jgi:hypothetical protein